MSAIYGIINKDGRPVEPEMLQKMKQAMNHRATQGSGELISGNAAFGFCHLVVYPNQEHEQLPLVDGDLLFTANAHLHNREELLKKLGFDGKQYATTSDSYLILQAYKKWGKDCVHHLDGEYVFVIWSTLSQQLFCAVDHIGFKPMYYYDTNEEYIFCSEIKGIEAVKRTANYFDEEALVELFFKKGDAASTYNKEVRRLGGGSFLKLNERRITSTKYWHPYTERRCLFQSDKEYFQCLQDIIRNAIKSRLNPNVKIGISLSGGLDSGSIACILSEILKEKNLPLYAFSSVAGDPENDNDEREYLEVISRHCGNIEQTFITAEQCNMSESLATAMFTDEQIPNSAYYMDHALLSAAKEKGVGIMYYGYGGDEAASTEGNTTVYHLLRNLSFRKALEIGKEVCDVYNMTATKAFKALVVHKIPMLTFRYEPAVYRDFVDCLKPGVKRNHRLFKNYETVFRLDKLIASNQLAKITATLFDNRNAYYNIASAIPFFDKNIIEFLLQVPPEYFLKGGYLRSFFRNSMKNVLPESIRWRKTKSSYVPDGKKVLENESNSIFSKINNHHSHIFEKYFDYLRLQHFCSTVQATKKTNYSSQGLILLKWSLNANEFIGQLEKKNYQLPD